MNSQIYYPFYTIHIIILFDICLTYIVELLNKYFIKKNKKNKKKQRPNLDVFMELINFKHAQMQHFI